MNPETLRKLRFPVGEPWLMLHPPMGFSAQGGEEALPGPQARVLLFVTNQAELAARLPNALERIQPDALFWIAYPKQNGAIRSDLNRDTFWKLVSESGCGLRPVAQVALDDTWSALRFRPEAKVRNAEHP